MLWRGSQVRIPAPRLTRCVTLGKLIHLSQPFFYLDNRTVLIELLMR